MSEDVSISRADAIALASRLLRADPELLQGNCEELDDHVGYRIWHHTRGGGSLIVSATDGSILFANSRVDPADHKQWFNEGRRTPEDLFE